MKNTHILLVGILLIIVGFGTYIYSRKDVPVVVANTSLSDEAFKSVLEDPEAKILARGDVNGDGFEDAVLSEMYCGASCSTSLQVVLNENNKTAKLLKDKNYPDTFSPAYLNTSAMKSEVPNVKIENGIISLTGKGLDCVPPEGENDCTEEKWNIVKTATYTFDGINIVQLSVK